MGILFGDSGMKRRQFLGRSLAGLTSAGIGLHGSLALAANRSRAGLLAPKPTHFDPKAKQLIVLFLTGGFSHVDTFDYKPTLNRRSGQDVPSFGLRPEEAHIRPLLGSPFKFRRQGESGLWISELFPNLGTVADELCVIRSLHTDIVEHFQAVLAMHTGSATVPLPSIGSWLSHGLGSFNANLPSYVVLCEDLPYAGSQVWSNGFLPADPPGRTHRARGRADPRSPPRPTFDHSPRARAAHATRRQ